MMQAHGPCPLCAAFDPPRADAGFNNFGEYVYFECPRCGPFQLKEMPGWEPDEEEALELSGAVRMAKDDDRQVPRITAETIPGLRAMARRPRSGGAFIDRVLEVLAELCKYPGRAMPQCRPDHLAARACMPTPAFIILLRMLQEEKFLGIAELDSVRLRAYLTTVGWARVDALARGGIRSKRAFVAMAFNPEMKKAYNEGIEPALLECGYEPPFLVDDPVHEERASEPDYQRKIDDRIFAEIRRSRFVIADATFRKVNVFLEAGFAEGLGLDVFWCCRSDQIEELAFDTRQIGHIVWTTSEDLRLAIVDRLGRRGLRLA